MSYEFVRAALRPPFFFRTGWRNQDRYGRWSALEQIRRPKPPKWERFLELACLVG
jgi:hypothetical protein